MNFQQIHPSELPSLSHEIPLFFHPEFVCRNNDDGLVSFIALEKDEVKGLIHFRIEEGRAISIPRSTYGGFYLTEGLNSADIVDFIGYSSQRLKDLKVKSLIIALAPSYFSYSNQMHEILLDYGFTVEYKDITQVLAIKENSFEKLVNRNRKRKLQTAIANAYSFEILKLEDLSQVYDLLLRNRKSRGYPMTMTLDDLRNTFERFPNRYTMFGVFDKEVLIAGSICVKINNSIIYDLYHGELPQYRTNSPVTLLLEGIYNYSINENLDLLDLGISTDKGLLNKGLYNFKVSCGAKDHFKRTYQINV